ncbi:MAG: hypothetical protein KKA84_05340 [Bacteroidetes bacterium]|nr:hypothetical protein [Bacteroidota bacterium]
MSTKKGIRGFFSILILFSIILITACSQNDKTQPKLPSEAKITRTDKNVEGVEREYNKAKYFGVSKRYAYSYFYQDGKETGGKLVEEISFNKKGEKVEHIKYSSKGYVDYRFIYTYSDDGLLQNMSSCDADGRVLLSKSRTYDEQGRNTGIEEIDSVDIKRTTYQIMTYQDSLMVERIVEDSNHDVSIVEKVVYDSLGYKIASHKTEPNVGVMSVYYVHDDFGNITEIVAPYYKVVMTYDERGNVINEELFSTESRQHKFVYSYDDDGLLLNKIRYDLEENMIFKMEFKYEFH